MIALLYFQIMEAFATLFLDGRVNVPYSDFESFIITDNCFDAEY